MTDWKEHGVKIVRAGELDTNTPQTQGMTRAAAITHARTGASKLWAGTVVVEAGAKTGIVFVDLLRTSVGRLQQSGRRVGERNRSSLGNGPSVDWEFTSNVKWLRWDTQSAVSGVVSDPDHRLPVAES